MKKSTRLDRLDRLVDDFSIDSTWPIFDRLNRSIGLRGLVGSRLVWTTYMWVALTILVKHLLRWVSKQNLDSVATSRLACSQKEDGSASFHLHVDYRTCRVLSLVSCWRSARPMLYIRAIMLSVYSRYTRLINDVERAYYARGYQ